MEWERYSTDQLEQQLLANQTTRSQLDAIDLQILEVLDERQTATADGCRSMAEWTASRLDVSLKKARTMVRTMRRTQQRPDLRHLLAAGDVTFDRVEALSRIPHDTDLYLHLDIAGVRREAAKRARTTADAEYRTAADQFMVLQPSLDESWWRLWGGLDGPTGALVDKTLTAKADHLPDSPDTAKGDLSWRKAIALAELCVTEDAPPTQVTVFVDAKQAAASNAESGVVLDAGVNTGRQALEAILCNAETEVIARTEDGRYLDYGRKQRTVTPTLKRALLDRYRHVCAIDGCNSRYRLEAHHLTAWAEGGSTNQQDLILVCWYHHQIVIHQQGFHPYEHPDHKRIRLRRPTKRHPPPP